MLNLWEPSATSFKHLDRRSNLLSQEAEIIDSLKIRVGKLCLLNSGVREPAVFATKKEHLGIENTPIFFTPCIFSRIAQLTKAFFPSLHSKVRSFPLPQHVTQSPIPTPSMITLHREWGFAVRLAIKYHSSLVCLFSPSGRDKQGKGIHYSCW